MEPYLLTAVVFIILWFFWKMLHLVFDLLDQHAAHQREDAKSTEGKVT